MQVARFQRVLPYWEGSLPRSCNCPLNGLYVLKPHGRSSSLRRAFRSWEYARRAASENAQSTNLAIISSSVVCTSKRAKNSLGIRIDDMSCLHKGNNCCSLFSLFFCKTTCKLNKGYIVNATSYIYWYQEYAIVF